MYEEQDLKEMELRRQAFIRKYGPHDVVASDMSGLLSEVSSLRMDKASARTFTDEHARIISAMRHLCSPNHKYAPSVCHDCERAQQVMEEIRKGEL